MRLNEEEPVVEEVVETVEEVTEDPTLEESPLDDFPEYATKAEITGVNESLKTLTDLVGQLAQNRQEPAKPVEPVKPTDTRSPMEVAQEEAEKSGNYNESWIYARAMEINNQRQQESFMSALAPILQPLFQTHALTSTTGGDAALNAEVQAMIDSGAVSHQALSDPNVKAIVIDAAKARIEAKTVQAKGFPDAGPTKGSLGAQSSGIRGKLSPAQRANLAESEKQWGKFTEDEILEAYFR